MIGYIADIEFVWGFQSRIAGLSKTSPSFYYPPPTTFLGSLAESISKKENIGEDRGRSLIPTLSKELLAIGLRPLNCVPIKYEDINRIIVIRKGTDLFPNPLTREGRKRLFDSPGRGKTLLSSLDGEAPKIRWFIVFKSNSLRFEGDKLELTEEHLWGIHRLGSKESRVSVIDVKVSDKLLTAKGRVISNYSFQVNKGIKPIGVKQERWIGEVYMDPYNLKAYDRIENPVSGYLQGEKLSLFMVPILVTTPPEYLVETTHEIMAYAMENEVILGRAST